MELISQMARISETQWPAPPALLPAILSHVTLESVTSDHPSGSLRG